MCLSDHPKASQLYVHLKVSNRIIGCRQRTLGCQTGRERNHSWLVRSSAWSQACIVCQRANSHCRPCCNCTKWHACPIWDLVCGLWSWWCYNHLRATDLWAGATPVRSWHCCDILLCFYLMLMLGCIDEATSLNKKDSHVFLNISDWSRHPMLCFDLLCHALPE